MKYIKSLITVVLGLLSITVYSSNQILPEDNHSITIFVKNKHGKKDDSNKSVFATYGGYIASTNKYGQIILPRKTINSDFYVLITEEINPVFSVLNNISHWQIPKNKTAKMYSIKKIDNKNWKTSKHTISKSKQVPLHTIVIFANPSDVSMNLGNSTTTDSEQLILPSIYIKKSFKNLNSSIKIPDIKPFWAKLKTAYELMPYGYATIPVR